MVLFFDSETNGLPLSWEAPVTDLQNWPRLVQLAYVLCDSSGQVVLSSDSIVRPDGFTIPQSAVEVHGISTERALKEGKNLDLVLQEFSEVLLKAELVVAHNISFDEKVVGAEFLRASMPNSLSVIPKICTMRDSTDFCALAGAHGNKWPKLSELYFRLFQTPLKEAHNAAVDVEATVKCFWELKRLGVHPFDLKTYVGAGRDEGNCQILIRSEESQEVWKHVEEHCEKNNFTTIPLGAKAKAVAFFEHKCRQVPEVWNTKEEIEFLSDFWSRHEGGRIEGDLRQSQSNFLSALRREIVENDMGTTSFGTDDKSLEDRLMSFDTMGLIMANESDSFRNLVIRLYYFYLTLYKEFIHYKEEASKKHGLEINLAGYSDSVKRIYDGLEKIISEFKSQDNVINADIPAALLGLVKKYSMQLSSLKSEVGPEDDFYLRASARIVDYATNFLSLWVGKNRQVLTIPIQGLSHGSTLLDVCIVVIREIDKIETHAESKSRFNEVKTSLTLLKERVAPDKGCFIATMAYGDLYHPQVLVLRDFRDSFLQRYLLGRVLVKCYYLMSPTFVELFGGSKIVRVKSKAVLDWFVRCILPLVQRSSSIDS